MYAAIKLEGAIVMSLAAIPVFFLALRLGQQRTTALLCSVAAVAVPEMLYSSWVLAEPYAYPLALAAVAAGSVALGGGGNRSRVAFILFAAAATLARAQFVALPLCFVAATFVVGLRQRALLAELRRQALVLGALVLPVSAALLLAPDILGFYSNFRQVTIDPVWLAGRLGTNGFVLLFTAGWLVVPGALFGLGLALVRPRSSFELGFGALSGLLSVALLLQASIYGDLDHAQGRYFFYVVPLLVLHFCLYASRGWPHARAYALLALSGVAVSAVVPISGFTQATGKTQSVVLLGVSRLEEILGVGTAALVVALVASAASLLAAALPRLGRHGATAGLVVTIALLMGVGALAARWDIRNTNRIRADSLPATATWVDKEMLGDVTLLQVSADRTHALSQLFWNRSLKDVVIAPGGNRPDIFASRNATIDADGTLRVGGRPLSGAVLADVWGSTLTFRDGRRVASSNAYELWRFDGPARLATYGLGFFRDGWLGARASLNVWPRERGGRLAGSVEMRLEGRLAHPVSLTIAWPGGQRHVVVAPGRSLKLVVPVCTGKPWRAEITTSGATLVDNRSVSVHSTRPAWRPGPGACAASPGSASAK